MIGNKLSFSEAPVREVGLWIIARGSGGAVWRVKLTVITPDTPGALRKCGG